MSPLPPTYILNECIYSLIKQENLQDDVLMKLGEIDNSQILVPSNFNDFTQYYFALQAFVAALYLNLPFLQTEAVNYEYQTCFFYPDFFKCLMKLKI